MDKHFIIIGTAKSGSSTLYKYLADHPEIHLQGIKEFNFFMNMGYDWGKNNKLKKLRRSLIFSLGRFIPVVKKKIIQTYFTALNKKENVYSGDGSINYFYFPEVPLRVKTYVPQAKLILVLRNPIDRLYSNYWMNKKQSHLNKNWAWQHQSFDDYIFEGHHLSEINNYATSLKRWLRFFNLDQLLIIESNDLFNETEATLKHVESFLDIKTFNFSEKYWETPFSTKPNDYPKMNDNTRQLLKEYFTPLVIEIQTITGKNFNWSDFK